MNSAAKHSLNKEELRERVEKIDFLFTHDADYLEYLYGFVPGGLKCKFCESTNLSKEYGDRTALCLPCGKITHLTASTVFHGVRLVREWLHRPKTLDCRSLIQSLPESSAHYE